MPTGHGAHQLRGVVYPAPPRDTDAFVRSFVDALVERHGRARSQELLADTDGGLERSAKGSAHDA